MVKRSGGRYHIASLPGYRKGPSAENARRARELAAIALFPTIAYQCGRRNRRWPARR
jgi:hypothetical protein